MTSSNDFGGSLLHDDQEATCVSIPDVRGVTLLLEMQLTSECRDNVENNQVRFTQEIAQCDNDESHAFVKGTITISDWAAACVK